MNFKQASFFSSTVLRGVAFNLLYAAVLAVIIYLGYKIIVILDDLGLPFTDFFLDDPRMILVLVLGPLILYFTYKGIRKESKDFSILIKTISQKLSSRLSVIGYRKDLLTKFEILEEYIEYAFLSNPDLSIKFYDNEFIDIQIKNVYENYFKIISKDPTTVQLNLLSVNDDTPNLKFIKKIFRTKPRMLEDNQINLVMELINIFSYFHSLKLNEKGFQLSIKMKFDNKNWKQIDNFLDDVESIISFLKKYGMYSNAV